jgi:hypothetical protein
MAEEEKPEPSSCPWLGSESDNQMRWSYATARHRCWSPQHPRDDPTAPCVDLEMELQRGLCLTDQHKTCAYYVPPPTRSPAPEEQPRPARAVCFFLGGKIGRFDYSTTPTGENACYSHAAPKPWWKRLRPGSYHEIAQEHQRSFCLRETFRNCPFFDEEK